MAIYSVSESSLDLFAGVLKRGGVVALPTETVYGLAVNAFDEVAIRQIFEIKQRPLTDPLIVHVPHQTFVERIAYATSESKKLMDAFWPGPLTLLLPKKEIIPTLVTASSPKVAIRCPNAKAFQEVLKRIPFPLAAPSANPFSRLSPTTAEHVYAYFGETIPILDGGTCTHGLESTLIDLQEDQVRLLRPGPIPPEAIAAIIGKKVETPSKKENSVCPHNLAPGQFLNHYCPKTPLYCLHWDIKNLQTIDPKAAYIFQFERDFFPKPPNFFFFNPTLDLKISAYRLFGLLHQLDKQKFSAIFVEKAPNEGIGIAINNRLLKASQKRDLSPDSLLQSNSCK